MSKTYKYVTESGRIEYLLGNFNWRSLCHNEEVMDDYPLYLEEDFLGKNLGWAVCRRCGKQANFVMRKDRCQNS